MLPTIGPATHALFRWLESVAEVGLLAPMNAENELAGEFAAAKILLLVPGLGMVEPIEGIVLVAESDDDVAV